MGDYWQNKAYVFTHSGSGWDRQALITSSHTAEGDKFGDAVFLSGDTALIGASGDDVGDYGAQPVCNRPAACLSPSSVTRLTCPPRGPLAGLGPRYG